jgi:pyrroloquinoline quinone (PQQ) biosynthesis protein C
MALAVEQEPQAMRFDKFVDDLRAFMKEHTTVPELLVGVFKGTAPIEAIRGYAKELYVFSLPMVPSIAAISAHADDRETLLRIVENLARECGYYQTPNHIETFFDFTRALGIADEELVSHVPMPETIGAMCTVAYFCRQSLEEGLGAFVLGLEGRYLLMEMEKAPKISVALKRNYGMDDRAVRFWTIHEGAEEEDAQAGLAVLSKYVQTARSQEKVRRAFQYTVLTYNHMLEAWSTKLLK